ncbi:MAG: hypothetical protein JNJ54_26525 [Myxococcaceae bacterium]|nr:hypothetical protein [Myxococcaceae bacterium]
MARAGWVLGLVVCLGAGLVRADPKSPLIDGDYLVGEMGVLRLSAVAMNGSKERFKVDGKYVSGTRCAFAPTEVLIEGIIDGTVLIATLRTCMEGSGCPTPNDVAILGVISEGVVTAYIDIPRGCSAPGLEAQRLVMEASASSLREAGNNFVKTQNYARAAAVYRRLTELPGGATDVDLLFRLGAAYNGLKRYQEGRAAFRKAMSLQGYGALTSEDKAYLLYNLACAEAGLIATDPEAESAAVGHLKEALELAKKPRLPLKENAAVDEDLQPLAGNPEFQKLLGIRKGVR